eukprot:g4430.t1
MISAPLDVDVHVIHILQVEVVLLAEYDAAGDFCFISRADVGLDQGGGGGGICAVFGPVTLLFAAGRGDDAMAIAEGGSPEPPDVQTRPGAEAAAGAFGSSVGPWCCPAAAAQRPAEGAPRTAAPTPVADAANAAAWKSNILVLVLLPSKRTARGFLWARVMSNTGDTDSNEVRALNCESATVWEWDHYECETYNELSDYGAAAATEW